MKTPPIAILAALLLAAPATAQQAAPVAATPAAPSALSAEQRRAAIADIVKTVQQRYVFPDRVPAIVARLEQSLAAGRYDTDNAVTFADRVTEDLRDASRDRHMYLNHAPDRYAAAIARPPAADDEASPELEAIWARDAERSNHGLEEMRILPGNVRYLRISGFHWVEDRTGAAYDAAMRFLAGGDAIVIDLRDNGGGSHAAVRYLLSHFMDGDRLDITFLQTGEDPVQSRTLEYLPAGRIKGRALFVLINNRTGSGAEAFAYDVKQFRLGTLVGATTGGAANNNILLPIAPGFMLSCSYGRPVHPVTGSNWEGVGVAPDVTADPARALETAQVLALAELINRKDAAAADRADWQWARTSAEAQLHPPRLPAARLRAWAGRYGSQQIVWQDGALFYQRRPGHRPRLIPLTDDGLFTVEGYADRLRIRLTGDAMETQWVGEGSPKEPAELTVD